MKSQVNSACDRKYGEVLNTVPIKNEILHIMRPETILTALMGDIIIVHCDEDLLTKHGKIAVCITFWKKYVNVLDPLFNFDDANEAPK